MGFFFIQAPRIVYLLCALGLFVYQSLDAIDGKQARRTKTSSPLGELFDHGCDSISTGKINMIMLTINNTELAVLDLTLEQL